MTHKHYVPILKTKAGEKWAIDRTAATLRSSITPLFEIHPHKKHDAAEHADSMCEELACIWSDRTFLDTCWLHASNGDPTIITSVFGSANSFGLNALPVVRLSYDNATLDVIGDIVAEDGRGCLLRVGPDESGDHARIDAVLTYIGLAPDAVEFLLDYKNIAMHLPLHLGRIPHAVGWRTLTAASGTFPRSVASLGVGTWNSIPRDDWTSWNMGIASSGIPRLPAFADYLIRDSGPAADFGDPSANLRYCKDDHWLVRVGGKHKAGGAGDMHTICADLITRTEYDGRGFSDGDTAIDDCGRRVSGSGAPQQWLQWAMNHHIAFTVGQLRSLP